MGMPGMEQVLDEVAAALQAGMASKVAALNAEYADAYAITQPAARNYLRVFDKPAAQALTSYPAVVIRPQPEDAQEPSVGGEYGVAHPVEVAFIVGPDSQLAQETRLLRYMRAAKEILGPIKSLDCGETNYIGGGFAREYTTDNGILRDVALLFTTTVYETP